MVITNASTDVVVTYLNNTNYKRDKVLQISKIFATIAKLIPRKNHYSELRHNINTIYNAKKIREIQPTRYVAKNDWPN